MKKLLSMVLCAMMALTLAGCGGSGDDSSTYTYSSELDIKNLDSADAEDGCSFTALHAIVDGLMKPAKDGTTTYGIAKSSEVSEDGLTHTYKLRDAKWSNGDAVTANDFVYAWQRIFKNKGNYYYMFCDGIANIAGAQELSDKIDAGEELTDADLDSLGVKAVDDKTLEVTTTTRVSFFDELMSFPCFYPINEKFAEKQGDKYGKSADAVLANGAFVMTNWEPGSVAEFEKNDKFYAAKDVKIDKLVMKLVQEPKVAAQSFEAGETDFAIINSDLVDKYKKDESFKNISEANLEVTSEEEKEQVKKMEEEKKSFLDQMKEALKEDVSDVRFSTRLVDSPVCLVSGEGGLSLGMEKVLQQMPNGDEAKATKILEINPHHELVEALSNVNEKEEFDELAKVLYDQALLIEGFPLKDPAAFSKSIAKLMVKATKK